MYQASFKIESLILHISFTQCINGEVNSMKKTLPPQCCHLFAIRHPQRYRRQLRGTFIQWESVIILDAKHLWYACCVFLLSTKVKAGFLLFKRKKTQWKIQMSCWFFVYQYIWEVCDILILMESLIQWAWHNPLTASCPYKPTVTNNNTRIYNCWQSLPYLLNTQRNIFESIGF